MNIKGMEDFGMIVLKTLSVNLPISYLEAFKDIKKSIERFVAKPPKVIVSGIGFLWNPAFAVWAAECKERGTTLVGSQHGGTYGECTPSYGEKYERSTSDYYISWRWEEDERVIPLPASRLHGIDSKTICRNR